MTQTRTTKQRYQAYFSGTNIQVVASYDAIPGAAMIDSFSAEGEPEYHGETSVHWNDQCQKRGLGEPMWLCENDDIYQSSELELRAVDDENEILQGSKALPFPHPGRRTRAAIARDTLREARNILSAIGADRAIIESISNSMSTVDSMTKDTSST